jgi:hypothetical protein
MQYLVLVLLIIVIISLPAMKRGAFSVGKVMLFWFPINAYWIFPVLYSLQWTFASAVAQYPPSPNLENLQIHVPTVIQAFAGTGYWTDFFTATIPSTFYPFWLLAALSVVCSVVVYLVTRRPYASVIPWTGILALSVALETGPNSPIRIVVEWMFVNIPPMVLFKSPQHLIFPTIISLSVLVGMFAVRIVGSLTKRSRIGITLALVILISIWVSPFFSGNLGGNVDVYQLSPGYQKINNIIAADHESGFRIMYLPAAASPLYLRNGFQAVNQGGDPMLVHSPAATLASDLTPDQHAKDLTSAVELLLTGPNPPNNSSKLLAFLNVKYVVLRYDVVPNFGPLAGRWNVTHVAENIQKLDGLRFVLGSAEATLWKFELTRAPLIYATNDVVYDNLPILGIRNWKALGGEWETNQMPSVTGTAGILRTDGAYGDFELVVETRLSNDQSSFDNWVLWRGRDVDNYYYAGQTGVGYFTVGEILGGQKSELYSTWNSFSRGQPVWIKILARGNTFQIASSNGTGWTSQFTFVDSGLQVGFVGLRPRGSGQFGNITISDLSGTLLYKETFVDSNLIRLILSSRFIIGQTVVLPTTDSGTTPNSSNASARTISASSTDFEISTDSSGPFFLVYAETFDPGWTISFPGSVHSVGNGYANVWKVNSSGTSHMSLFFQPQQFFQLGLAVTLGAIGSIVVLTFFGQRRLMSALTRARQTISGFKKTPGT